LTIGQVLERTSQEHGDREAAVFLSSGWRRSWRQFREEVRQTARALLALGLGRGEHVGIWATNLPQWFVLQFAAAEVGAVLVTINPAYRAGELAYVLKQADIAALFLTDRFKTSDYFALLQEALASEALPRLREVVSVKEARPALGGGAPRAWSWPEFAALHQRVDEAELDRRAAECQPEDVINIQYTSGTTGFPKGAMLSHRNLLYNVYYCGQRMRFGAADRLCVPVPFYHCFGCVLGTLLCVVHGSTMVVPGEWFDALATLEAIARERCTAVYGVPTMFLAEVQHPRLGEFDLSSLRTGIMAGSPCPVELMKAVMERMGARQLTIGYGLTENAPLITQTDVDDDLEHRTSTVGRPLPGMEVRIVAPGTLQPLPAGQPGELLVRGPCVMKGYYRKPQETAEAITADGWLHTGDLALETADGYYRIVGRIKDMIIRGGENIYPREIEEFLYTHPAIADVQVVGLPDAKYGEEVSAWIRLKPGHSLTEEEVRSFCRGRIAHYKIPRYVVFVEEFPTTVTGKIQKYRLRQMGIERFGLAAAAATVTA
jgi:fatty-acyl-CoA synthase